MVTFRTHAYRVAGLAWFRVLGFGLHIKDTRRHRLIFSERYGYRPGLMLGPWRVRPLWPWRYP